MPSNTKPKRSAQSQSTSRASSGPSQFQQNVNKIHQSSTPDNSDDIQEIVPVKSEVYQEDVGASSALVNADNYAEYDQEYEQYEEQGNYDGAMVPDDGGKGNFIQI